MTTEFSLIGKLEEHSAAAESLAALAGSIREKSYAADGTIVQQGDHAPQIFFLKSGLVKLVYLTPDGREFIKSFIDAGALVGSLVSLLEGGAATFSIICLEPAKVEMIPYAVLARLADQDGAILRFISALYQNLALRKEIREHDFLCLTAAQRYRNFLQNQPNLAGRITPADSSS